MLDAVTQILSSGRDVLDACWDVWRNAKIEEDEELLLVAHDLVHLLHCYAVCEDLVDLLARAAPADPLTLQPADAYDLEECAILTSKIFFPLQDKNGIIMTGDVNTKSQWIRNELDRIAAMVREDAAAGVFDAAA